MVVREAADTVFALAWQVAGRSLVAKTAGPTRPIVLTRPLLLARLLLLYIGAARDMKKRKHQNV